MRGTGYAVLEIIWWMLVAGLIGVAIGWILRSFFGGGARLEESEARLEHEKERYAQISGELGDWKRKVDALETEAEKRTEQLTEARETGAQREEELTATRAEASDLGGRVEQLEADLEAAAAPEVAADVAELRSELAEREQQLDETKAELSELRSDRAARVVEHDEMAGRLAGLEAALAARDAKSRALQSDVADGGGRAESADLEALAAGEAEDGMLAVAGWQHGTTELGTPGDEHKDDLKVINGVGPKLERILNGFGIRSWEQLATLTPAEVARVDAALDEFPRRIHRDEWVAQAADLVARFPDRANRPTREQYLNEAPD